MDVCILRGARVLVPEPCRQALLKQHEDHPGICHIKSLARIYIWWAVMDK